MEPVRIAKIIGRHAIRTFGSRETPGLQKPPTGSTFLTGLPPDFQQAANLQNPFKLDKLLLQHHLGIH